MKAQKTYHISRIATSPVIDGIADDSIWQHIPVADGFTTTLPRFGQIPQFPTTVKMAFDNRGIYITADCRSDKTRAEGSHRDDAGTGDYFSVGFDTWNDDQNAFVFGVTAGGQIIDQRISSTQTAVGFESPWKARTYRDAGGWTAEIWIPFTALRFPAKGSQDWGLQFTRFDRTTGETSTWNPQDPAIKDVVWQYGQLSGLTTPERQLRLGLSLLRQTKINTESTASPGFSLSDHQMDIALAVDGRIGFNPATTLDFSILPAVNFLEQTIMYDERNVWKRLLNNGTPEMPEDRLLNTEESGVPAKTSSFWRNPYLFANDLIQGVNPQPNELVFTRDETRILQETRFHTRTRSNIGISVSNTIFNRPLFVLYIPTTFDYTSRYAKYPVQPVYNHIAVEKAFRNNSWIQASTGNLVAGKGLNVNNSSVGGQWRDKTNRFEAGGHLLINTQFVSEGNPYTRADGRAHIGKVNGKYLWNADYRSPANTSFGIFESRTYFDYAHTISGSVTQQNFQPASHFFRNTRHSLTLLSYWGGDDFARTRALVSWTARGLDQKFRSFSGKITSSPLPEYETLHYTTLEIRGRRSLPAGAFFEGSTDTRKKTVWSYGAGFDWRPYNRQFSPRINCSPRWVLGHKWIIDIDNSLSLPSKNSRPIVTSSNKYLFERSSNWNIDHQTTIRFYPGRKLAFDLRVFYYADVLRQRKAFEILTTGEKTRADYTFPTKQSYNKSFGSSFEINWYYSPIKHFRFLFLQSQAFNDHLSYNQLLFPGTTFITEKNQILIQWSWVWNMANKS